MTLPASIPRSVLMQSVTQRDRSLTTRDLLRLIDVLEEHLRTISNMADMLLMGESGDVNANSVRPGPGRAADRDDRPSD